MNELSNPTAADQSVIGPQVSLPNDTILVTCAKPAFRGAFQWGLEQPPSFLQYKYILLEIPSRNLLREEVVTEILISLRRGARVAWFLSENTEADAAQRIIGTAPQRIRPTTLGDARPKDIALALAPTAAVVSYVFNPTNPWSPLGMWANVDSTWLAARPFPSQGVEILAPCPPSFEILAIKEIRDAMDAVSLNTGPLSLANRALSTILLLSLIVFVAITAARYWQRDINLSMLSASSRSLDLSSINWRTSPAIAALVLPDKNSSIEEFFPQNKNSAIDVFERLNLFQRINLLGAHVKLTKQIIQAGSDTEKRELAKYLSSIVVSDDPDSLYEDHSSTLTPSRVETSRYLSQYYINTIYGLSDDATTQDNSTSIYAARRVIDLTKDNFLWSAPGFLEAFSTRQYENIFSKNSPIARDIRPDYVDYAKTAFLVSRNEGQIDPQSAWSSFLERWPNSSLSDDAQFNILKFRIGAPVKTEEEKSRIYRDALDFARKNPSSTLADDALLYAWRFSIAQGNSAGAVQAASILQGKYSYTDGAAIMRNVVNSSLRLMPVVDTLIPIDVAQKQFISPPSCTDHQSDEELNTLHLLAFQKPRPANSSSTCEELLAKAYWQITNLHGW